MIWAHRFTLGGDMKRIAMVALLAATLAVPAAAQGTFEGLLVGSMTMPDGKTMPFRYYQLGSRIRQEYTIEGHTMSTIWDGTTGDMIMIIPQQKKYTVMNMRSASGTARQLVEGMSGKRGGAESPDFSKMKVTATGRRETIAGITCEHYLFQNTDTPNKKPMDMCGATGMGFMGMAGETGMSMMPSTVALLRSQNPELARIARQGFFPLKMTFSSDRGDAVWTAVSIDRRRPDAALFQPPAGYTQLQMPTMGGKP